MAHLSHIIKTTIEPRYLQTFPAECSIHQYDLSRGGDNPNWGLMHFGSAVEELATTIADIRPNREKSILPPIPKMIGYDIKACPVGLTRTNESVDDRIVYTIEDQHTLPGYVRVKVILGVDDALSELVFSRSKCSQYHLHSSASLDRNQKVFLGIRCPIWPDVAREWLTRERPAKWPSEEIVALAKEDECFLISRPHPHSSYPDAEWQWVFPTTEKRIALEALSDEQKYCFRIFKVLVDFHTRNLSVGLTTTHLKTVMYTTCEILTAELWQLNPGGCLLFLLHRLVVCLRLGVLPNYFIPANNMIDHFSKGQLCALRQRLYAVRVFPISAVVILVEHYNLFGTCFLNRTLKDIVRFRKHRNLHRSIAECFLRNYSMYFRAEIISTQFKNAKRTLEDAFFVKTDRLPGERVHGEEHSFDKFFLDFAGDEFGDLKGFVAYEMDRACECDFTRLLHSSSEFVHLQDILDVDNCLEYSDVPIHRSSVDSQYKELMFLETLTSHFTQQYMYEKSAHFLRCAIKKAVQAIQCGNEETTEHHTTEVKVERVRHAQMSLYNYALLRFYHDLYGAYKSMGQTELMQEYIEDYEAVCLESGYTFHYTRVANIWQKLGNRDRAQSLKDQAESIKSSQKRRSNMTRYDSFDDID